MTAVEIPNVEDIKKQIKELQELYILMEKSKRRKND